MIQVDESSIFSRSPSFRERLEAQLLRVEFLHKIIGGRKPSQMTFEPASDTDGLERHTEGGLPGVSRRKQDTRDCFPFFSVFVVSLSVCGGAVLLIAGSRNRGVCSGLSRPHPLRESPVHGLDL